MAEEPTNLDGIETEDEDVDAHGLVPEDGERRADIDVEAHGLLPEE